MGTLDIAEVGTSAATTTRTMPPRVRDVLRHVCLDHQIVLADLLGPSGRTHLVAARWDCWARVRAMTAPNGRPFSISLIARWCGVHHTTVIHGIAAHRAGRSPWAGCKYVRGSNPPVDPSLVGAEHPAS